MSAPSLSGNPPLLVGREHELTVLHEHLSAARAGRGSLMLLGGEAGAGKSALADTLCREAAEQGALVLVGHCYDLTETPPYGPWVELFGRYRHADGMPPLPTAFAQRGTIGHVSSQAALFQEVGDFLTAVASQQSLILVLEDLHWSDPASLDLLRFVAHTLSDHPILALAVYRVDEITRRHPLFSLIPLLVRESGADRLDVHRLTDDAIRTLVATRYRLPHADETQLVEYLRKRAEGNALFVGELLRALEEQEALRRDGEQWAFLDTSQVRVPSLLKQVIGGRVARLGEDAQLLLGVAAVIGQEVPLETWAAVGGVEEEALSAVVERAAEGHIVEETASGTHARFAHALVRETLYDDILPSRRRRLHRQVAEALERQTAPDFDTLVYHYQEAGDERAIRWLVVAGVRAESVGALLTASERFEAALHLLEARGGHDVERGWLLFYLARMHRYRDTYRSLRYSSEAVRLAAEVEDIALSAMVTWYHGMYRCNVGEVSAGLSDMLKVVAIAHTIPTEERPFLLGVPMRPAPSGAITFRVGHHEFRATVVMQLANIGRVREACQLGEDIIADMTASAGGGTPRLRTSLGGGGDMWLGLAGANATLGRLGGAQEAVERAFTIYSERNNHVMVVGTLHVALQYVVVPYETEQVGERQRLMAEAARAWAQAVEARGDFPDAIVRFPVFRVDASWPLVRDVIAAVPQSRPPRYALGQVALWQGDTEVSRRIVDELFPDGPATEPGEGRFLSAIELQRVAAAMALDAGDRDTARKWLEMNDRWLAWSGAVLGQADGQLAWATYFRVASGAERARRHGERALALASEPRQPLALIGAHRVLGELDTDAGRFGDARVHLNDALALAETCAAFFDRALTLLALAEWHAATGSGEEARPLLDQVRTICTPLHAAPTIARADALASRLTAPTPHRPPTYPAGLTTREVDVLRLVATGLSNAAIADRLFLSERTIEQHLRSVYTKIGSSSRAVATRFAVEHHLT